MRGTEIALLPRWAHNSSRNQLSPLARGLLRAGGFTGNADVEDDTYFLTVTTTTACNLGCGYCFQNTAPAPRGTNRPPRIPHATLTEDSIREILDFTHKKMHETARVKLDVLLFGGEPLLNPAACLSLLRQSRSYGLSRGGIVTNATLLDARLAVQLEEAGLAYVQVSFDGDRATHDSIRVTRSGGPTFDVILNNLGASMAATNLEWQLRVNVSSHNYARLDELIDQLSVALDAERTLIAFDLINDVGIGHANSFGYTDIAAEHFVQWSLNALERGFMIRIVPPTSCSYCAETRGRRGAVTNANGVLYSCWESVGKPGMEVGTVTDGYLAEPLERRWVACGYSAASHGDRTSEEAFRGRIDGAVLDWLYEHDKLNDFAAGNAALQMA